MVESYNSITDQKFLFAIKFVLNNEGGYSNNNNDNGGETKYGISKRMYPDLDISSLTINEAIKIYYRDFWSTNRYYEIDDEKIAAKVFDLSINIGVKEAIILLQQVLNNSLCKPEYLVLDGILGTLTIKDTNNMDSNILLKEIKIHAAQYYVNLSIKYPGDKVFLAGWIKRAYA